MPQILPILAYPDFLTGDFSFKGSESRDIPYADGNSEKHLLLHYESPVSLTSGFQFSIGEAGAVGGRKPPDARPSIIFRGTETILQRL